MELKVTFYIMKKIAYLTLLTLLCFYTGCEKETSYASDDVLIENNINDVSHVWFKYIIDDSESSFYFVYGLREGKDWYGLFDSNSKKLIEEWYGINRIEKNIPFPENEEFTGSTNVKARCTQFKNGDIIILEAHAEGEKQLFQIIIEKERPIKYHQIPIKEEINCRAYGLPTPVNKEFIIAYTNKSEQPIVIDLDGNTYVTNAVVFQDNYTIGNYEFEHINYITGFKNDKIWIGIFNQDGIFNEYTSIAPYSQHHKIDIGYGESIEYTNDILNLYLEQRNFGYTSITGSYQINYEQAYHELLLINNDFNIYIYPFFTDYGGPFIWDWYMNSVIVDNKIISNKGELITTFPKEYKLYNTTPISYEEGIECTYSLEREIICATRYNYKENKIIWFNTFGNITEIKEEARVKLNAIEQNSDYIVYECNIINKDGSKANITLRISIETGKIIRL